jgi:hypothetical protein
MPLSQCKSTAATLSAGASPRAHGACAGDGAGDSVGAATLVAFTACGGSKRAHFKSFEASLGTASTRRQATTAAMIARSITL